MNNKIARNRFVLSFNSSSYKSISSSNEVNDFGCADYLETVHCGDCKNNNIKSNNKRNYFISNKKKLSSLSIISDNTKKNNKMILVGLD